MSGQVLAGSTAEYIGMVNPRWKNRIGKRCIITQDTCANSSMFPIQFEEDGVTTFAIPEHLKFIDKRLGDT